ncbi:MAG: hypothetical protein KTU85_00340 [Acidimicrobiia bacterium]|nr:hypothetical protein [Acidimicrobiia bacterium]MCY4458306.1 hypothetical protein [Acidimicrobiaceae bacterium]
MRNRTIIILACVLAAALLWPQATTHGQGSDGTEVTEVAQGIQVTAGTQGSLGLTTTPGRPGRGPTLYCAFYNFQVTPEGVEPLYTGGPVHIQPNTLYLVNCWTDRQDEPYAGYPITVVTGQRFSVPGAAVVESEAAQYAVEHLNLEVPKIVLSPPSQQIVGVPTWLAITSRVQYPTVSANAGPVWASVKAQFRSVTWDLGDGSPALRCFGDFNKVWDRTTNQPQSSNCTYTYTHNRGAPYKLRATVHWDIWQRTNSNQSWHLWGPIRRSASISVPVTQLQSAIR